MMVEIHNELEKPWILFSDVGQRIVGTIRNVTALDDVLVQIKREYKDKNPTENSPYYFEDESGERYYIRNSGKILHPPKGLFEDDRVLLKELVGF